MKALRTRAVVSDGFTSWVVYQKFVPGLRNDADMIDVLLAALYTIIIRAVLRARFLPEEFASISFNIVLV